MDPTSWLRLLDLFGAAVFAVSGALSAGRKRMDIFGAIVLGHPGGFKRGVIVAVVVVGVGSHP